MNSYKESLLKSANSSLEKIFNDANMGFNKDYKKVDDFFSFFIEDLKISPIELSGYMTPYLSFILYHSAHTKIEERKAWRDLFKPALMENGEYFKSCLNLFLKSSLIDTTPFEEDFKSLVDLGIHAGHFQKIKSHDLLTAQKAYREYLTGQNVNNVAFSTQALLNNINENYIANYISDIIKTPNIINQLNKNHVTREFFIQFMKKNYQLSDNERAGMDKFVQELYQSPVIKEATLKDHTNAQYLFKMYPNCVLPFLENLTIQETWDFYVSAKTYHEAPVIGWLKIAQNFIVNNDTLSFLQIKVDSYNPDPNLFNNFLLKYAEYNYEKLKDMGKTEFIDKNLGNIIDIFNDILSDERRNGFKPVEALISQINFAEKLNPEQFKKYHDKVSIKLQTKLYEILKPEKSEYTISTSSENALPLILYTIKVLKLNHVLDILNLNEEKPSWPNRMIYADTNYTSKNNQEKVSYMSDFPLAFHLINRARALDWFLKPENIDYLSDIKYNKKSFIPAMLQYLKGQDKKLFKEDILKIAKNKLICDKFIDEKAMVAISKEIIDEKWIKEVKASILNTRLSHNLENDKGTKPKIVKV